MANKLIDCRHLCVAAAVLISACASGPEAAPKPSAAIGPPANEPVAAPKPFAAIPPSTDLTLTCTGPLNAEGYPFGKQPTRQAALRIAMNKDPSLTGAAVSINMTIMVNGRVQSTAATPPPLICPPSKYAYDKCTAHQDDNSLTVSGFFSGTSTTLTLNKRTGDVRYGRGGMDGGSDFEGICRPDSKAP